MKINEVAGKFPMMDLPAQTMLFHGTNSGDFMVPDGPAWFAFSADEARRWIGWAPLMPGRKQGAERVLVFQNYSPINLVDTRSEQVWRAFCQALTGDPDIGIGVMAQAVKKAGYQGWYGDTEIMLSDPIAHIFPRGVAKPNGA